MSKHAVGAAVLAAVVLVARPGRAADSGADAAASYRIDTDGSTRAVAVGGQGRVVLAIQPAPRWHVHPEAPLKVHLEATAGMKVAKTDLGHKDAVNPAAEAPRFEVPFTGVAAGAQRAQASLDFFICSDAACVKQTRTVTVPVDVK